jgi:hypothetical protein
LNARAAAIVLAFGGCAQILGADVSPESLNPCACSELTKLNNFDTDDCNARVDATFTTSEALARAVDAKCDLCGEVAQCYELLGDPIGAPCAAPSACASLACCDSSECCDACQGCSDGNSLPFCLGSTEKFSDMIACLDRFVDDPQCSSVCEGAVLADDPECVNCLKGVAGSSCDPQVERCERD